MRSRLRACAAVVAVLGALVGCGGPSYVGTAPAADGGTGLAHGAAAVSLEVPAPLPFTGATATPDILVYAAGSLPARLRGRIAELPGVGRTVSLAVGSLSLGGRTVSIVAAEPSALRRFTAREVAGADAVWTRVAAGEAAVQPWLRGAVDATDGYLPFGAQPTSPRAYVAAFASLPSGFDVVLNDRWGHALGIAAGNAVLVSAAEGADLSAVVRSLERVVAERAAIRLLGDVRTRPAGPQTGYLTGGDVAAAVGSFTYRPRPDGTVAVDPAWVSENIRSEEVPILGRVTCHRVLLPQLRAAMKEVEVRGLADRIRPGEYGGCFYPRYIGYDPAKGLSLHSWGIAVDLNVPGNLRGTEGEMDRDVVAIFKKWGFAWGGDWAWTDPMHFELAALVRRG